MKSANLIYVVLNLVNMRSCSVTFSINMYGPLAEAVLSDLLLFSPFHVCTRPRGNT